VKSQYLPQLGLTPKLIHQFSQSLIDIVIQDFEKWKNLFFEKMG
jgi:hypothetical protein